MEQKDPSESALGRLNERLYSPRPVDGVTADPLREYAPAKPEAWKPEPVIVQTKAPRFSASALFLMFAVGFFAIAGITAATVLFLGGRSVSSDHLSIEVDGATSVSGGELSSFHILVTNNNPLPVRGAVLEVDFPEGVFAGEDASEPLLHVVEELGDIEPGKSVRKTVRAAFFGEENRRISVPITVEYTTDNSNATFVTEDSYDLVLSTAPVTLSVETVSEVPAGQPLTLTLLVRSNATAPLENVAVRAEYPFGFLAAETTPVAQGDVFTLGTLEPGEEERIVVTGPLAGLEGEERVFRFVLGTLKDPATKEFAISYSTKEASVAITKSFLAVDLAVNREAGETVIIRSGQTQAANVSWENALATPVLDGRILISIEGDAFDPSSVKTTGAFYRSSDRSVLFDASSNAALANLAPGASGGGAFTFSTKTGSAMESLRNPSITLVASVSGRRVGENRVTETVTSTLKRTLKVATDLSLAPRAVRTVGPFENQGPWPPLAEQKTTYTVLLSAKNTVNSVAGATVSTVLPSYVRFTGQSNPVGAVSYSEATREVVWDVGEMAAGAAKDAAFQVELLPSTSQRGTSPTLTGEFLIKGTDRFVQQEVSGKASALTTQIATDPEYASDKGTVK